MWPPTDRIRGAQLWLIAIDDTLYLATFAETWEAHESAVDKIAPTAAGRLERGFQVPSRTRAAVPPASPTPTRRIAVMAIKVELKARVPDRDRVVAWLAGQATGEPSTYRDTYYDWPDGSLERDGRKELRVRVIDRTIGFWAVVTFKGPMPDSTSRPVYGTTVTDARGMDAILLGLGLGHAIAYEKRCINYRFPHHGHAIIATLVDIPELPDDTFLEVETLLGDNNDTSDALNAIRSVLTQLGLGDDHLEEEFYIDLVRRQRSGA
jgi:adenylate cyclase, class 2